MVMHLPLAGLQEVLEAAVIEHRGERGGPHLAGLSKVNMVYNDSFPYTVPGLNNDDDDKYPLCKGRPMASSSAGSASGHGRSETSYRCRVTQCSKPVDRTAPKLLQHTAAHILARDLPSGSAMALQMASICGWCGSGESGCKCYLTKGYQKGAFNLAGNCNLMPVKSGGKTTNEGHPYASCNYKTALEYKAESPCTNIPEFCPRCPAGTRAVWRYCMLAHIQLEHCVRDEPPSDDEIEQYAVSWDEFRGILAKEKHDAGKIASDLLAQHGDDPSSVPLLFRKVVVQLQADERAAKEKREDIQVASTLRTLGLQ